ncbi:hypothetical protein [Agrobacterium rosae]|uniref:Uncharacterized protein n=1 Tax=Agrobacterium rosae TaxID=1972867 RepID=A0AAW9FU11_9HYPH|nr:hypothetical protein [Agrobacterium rosae]MDX8306039.1 hypothetical protein [Agrobacterium rosae]
MSIDERPDKHGTAEGAHRLALTTVIRALVDNASVADPGLRKRITTDVEAYIMRLDPQSELEFDFAERARSFAANLLKPSDS